MSLCDILEQDRQIISVAQRCPKKACAFHDCECLSSVLNECISTYLLHKVKSHDVSVVLDEAFASAKLEQLHRVVVLFEGTAKHSTNIIQLFAGSSRGVLGFWGFGVLG